MKITAKWKLVRWVGGAMILLCLGMPFLTGANDKAQSTSAATSQAKPAAQSADTNQPVHLTAERDHQRMMDLLHITSIRRGADGDPKSPNAANYDETKAGSDLKLPDPLRLNDGKEIKTAKDWWNKRRPEIVEDFDREIYGRTPKITPKVNWEVISTAHEQNGDVPVVTKKLIGHVDNSAFPAIKVDIQLTLSTPENARGPVPVMMELGLSPEVMAMIAKRFPDLMRQAREGPSWQQQVLAKGWGYAEYIPTSVQADNGAGLTEGIIGLVNKGQPRKLDDWGALKAWAWGASRALDYFETDKAVNAKQVGIEGHSRYGKAALIAMAYDPRFAIGYISSSGAGGAELYRRNFGEQIGNLAGTGEYHWFDGNFLKYDGPLAPQDLPVDSHELIALCAPRPVFISGGAIQGDGWVDPHGMFLAAVGAGPVYRLLGKKDLGTTDYPPIGTPLISGDIAFRQHTGGHTPAPNWPTFIEFASRYIKGPGLAPKSSESSSSSASANAYELKVSGHETLETHGLSVLLFHNSYHPVFGDQKMSGIEMILQDRRIATNGDVRLSPTPEQWSPIPMFKERKKLPSGGLTALCTYEKQGFSYHLDLTPEPGGFRVAVRLDEPLPAALAGKAAFNFEFLPAAYFGKTYWADGQPGLFPRRPDGQMQREADGNVESLPLASGKHIILSPEDPLTRVAITSDDETIKLFDGRNKAQNGWFVLRSLIPADKAGEVVVWHIRPNVIPGWVRPPVVGYNEVGYTPGRKKIAVIEMDPLFHAPKTASVLEILPDGETREVFEGEVRPWGKWMRYDYAVFDFSKVREPGTYEIEYAGVRNRPFRIAENIYEGIWRPSLDVYLAEQMDHVKVREGYRIWHGLSHLDDARQAPVNYTHFDGYAQGPSTDSPFEPGQHIPGINVGGWFDAGDFDLRTQTHVRVITDLVLAREKFGINGDDTSVDEQARYVQMHTPDGVPDSIEQIEHGILYLLAQYHVIGHAISGIIAPTLQEYTHLGDAASKTDGRIYVSSMGPLETDGLHSGVPDDRWAFTTHITALNYDGASALAAASRALRGFNDKMADDCLQTAEQVWTSEHQHAPAIFHYFNTTGGDLRDEEVRAAVELLLATKGGEAYRARLKEMLPVIEERFAIEGWTAVRAIPFMDKDFSAGIETALRKYMSTLDTRLAENPYGVPIATGTWGGSGVVAGFAVQMYFFHEAFPDIVGPEYTLRALDYVLGTHPVSNESYVSGVGTHSRLIAYGNNRADYTFIPGGMIPGVTIVQPDFPELDEGWPFLWYENEYVIDAATGFILTANAAQALLTEQAHAGR
ncbi:MAG TPA: glycoside hydrolase family 9 protein [Candidatus Acidoferrum sp.]|nr:glycoside hydrolase family 9 protein [Candidatus Acidoferrum sp.]